MTDILYDIKKLPLVTVYIPTYNRVDLLKRAVDSVLNQEYLNIELIVVDDNSRDTTIKYLTEVVECDSRVSFYVNKKNSGACVSRNKAIFLASGEFITGLDDDDYFLPGHIVSFVNGWKDRGPSTVALYANICRKTAVGVKYAYRRKGQCKAEHLVHADWPGNQIFTKTEYLVKAGGFDPRLPAWQDLDCWYSLLKDTDGTAECTGIYSYVLDVSHPHERISMKNIGEIENAYNIFCDKHDLSVDEREIAALMLTHYTKVLPRPSAIFKKLVSLPSWHNFRHVFIMYYICLFK